MSIFRGVSARAGAMLCRRYRRRLAAGGVWRMPYDAWYGVWGAAPRRVRSWLLHRVLWAGDHPDAAGLLSADHPLSADCHAQWSEFSLTPVAALALWELLCRQRPLNVVEFGSGLSTVILARYAQRRAAQDGARVQILSIEHEAEWLQQTRQRLNALELEPDVQLLSAPLAPRSIQGQDIMTYDVPAGVLAERTAGQGFDFCLIDGPPWSIGRQGTLPTLAPFLTAGATVLLDDAYRAGERAAWEAWQRWFPGQLIQRQIILTCRGMAHAAWRGLPMHSTDAGPVAAPFFAGK